MKAKENNSSKNNINIIAIIVVTVLLAAWLLLTEKYSLEDDVRESGHGHEGAEEEEVAYDCQCILITVR